MISVETCGRVVICKLIVLLLVLAQKIKNSQQTSMPPVGFEPAIPASERP